MTGGDLTRPVYLDNAATTRVDPRVAAAMAACLTADSMLGNASSVHLAGRAAIQRVERAREQLAGLLQAPARDLIWTSGATESDNLAIAGAARYRAHRGRHLVTMPTEHKAVTDTCKALQREGFDVTWLEPAADGMLSLAALEAAIRPDTQLVSIMHVNNETGVVQDLEAIGACCRQHDILFHTDAAQSVGKLQIDLGSLPVDLLSLTAHKFHGPQGIGALYIADRPGCRVQPLLFGGGQERRLRPGTLPLHQIVGLGEAASLAQASQARDLQHLATLRDRLWAGIRDLPGVRRNGGAEQTFPGILNVSIDGVEGESLMLAMEPVCVASGSACNARSGESSYVLRALGLSDLEAQSAIRFSFGRDTTTAEIDTAVARYRQAVGHLRSIAPDTPQVAPQRA
ncbi:MAG: cysteine desulfurase [Gammaproteobacteria bacterium]|nr:MAG: cysteine desulfurase [Gammaproteobacteria bacterium]